MAEFPGAQERPACGCAAPREAADAALDATHAVVLAGGLGTRLCQLTETRAKPAMPFGGPLAVIDFTLSNCTNSGVRRISVLTQYKADTLTRHLTQAARSLNSMRAEVLDVVPSQQRQGACGYRGTADAVYQNLWLLRASGCRHVLVLAGDHVYKMDYRRIVADHARRGADVTVACTTVPLAHASSFGVMRVDADHRVVGFEEKPRQPVAADGRAGSVLVSMGIYVFDREFLERELRRDAAERSSGHDFGCDLIPAVVARARVFAHDHRAPGAGDAAAPPYWRDVGTVDAYWEAHMDLLGAAPTLDPFDAAWPIRGLGDWLAPARFATDDLGRPGVATDSLVCGGAVVLGASVRRSVLFPRATVAAGSEVDESLLLPGVVVGRNAVLRRVIVDEHCVVPAGIRIGVYPAEDRARFTVTAQGVTLVTAAMLAQR